VILKGKAWAKGASKSWWGSKIGSPEGQKMEVTKKKLMNPWEKNATGTKAKGKSGSLRR